MSRILVISDDQPFAFSLRVLLMRDGHSVMVAEDASAGLFRLFMDEPWFVVARLRVESEVRKVCRYLHENAKVPFLVIGNVALMEDPALKACLSPGSFLPLPVSVRRIWFKVSAMLRHRPDPPTGTVGNPGSDGGARLGRGQRSAGPGCGDRPAERHCRAYARYSQIRAGPNRGPLLQIWV